MLYCTQTTGKLDKQMKELGHKTCPRISSRLDVSRVPLLTCASIRVRAARCDLPRSLHYSQHFSWPNLIAVFNKLGGRQFPYSNKCLNSSAPGSQSLLPGRNVAQNKGPLCTDRLTEITKAGTCMPLLVSDILVHRLKSALIPYMTRPHPSMKLATRATPSTYRKNTVHNYL